MSKLERLLNLTAVLLDTAQPLTAEEIRSLVEGYPPADASFRRSFERDKDDLRSLGIPLRIEKVPLTDPPLDGYRIPPDEYYLPDPGLSPDELAALHLASLAVKLEGLGGTEAEALWKLGGVDQEAGAPLVEPQLADLPSDPALIPMFAAIRARQQVGFLYKGEQRRVDPWRLSFQRGRWYLSGHDHLRGGERNYRLDRVENDVELIAGTTWSHHPPRQADGHTLQAWEMGDDEITIVRLLVDADRVDVAARQLPADVGREQRADGSVVFDVPVVNREAFRSFVLGFLDSAEVLEPSEVRADVVGWLTAMVDT
ncbi:MAG: proteasome accessory factor B [Acidimicrobiales bacterium]|jgi:proteasome accessory factor B